MAQQNQIRIQLASTLIAVLCQALIPRIDVRGRVAAYEFMVVTGAISNLIRENKVFRIPSSIQTGKKFGMQLLDEHLFRLVSEGKISAHDAVDQAQQPGQLQDKIEGFQAGRIAKPEESVNPKEQVEPVFRS